MPQRVPAIQRLIARHRFEAEPIEQRRSDVEQADVFAQPLRGYPRTREHERDAQAFLIVVVVVLAHALLAETFAVIAEHRDQCAIAQPRRSSNWVTLPTSSSARATSVL